MDFRFNHRNNRGQFEAGPSFVSRNDPVFAPSYGRGTPLRDTPSHHSNKHNQSKKWLNKDGRQNWMNNRQTSRSDSVSSDSSSIRMGESSSFKNYICPKCKYPYNYTFSNNILHGKVPRILPCKHTVCEECIDKGLKTTNEMECAICSTKEIKNEQLYDYNHYILGQITCRKFNKGPLNFPNLALTPTDSRKQEGLKRDDLVTCVRQICGFKNCENTANVSCTDCCSFYCKECDDAIHKSVKQLLSHKRTLTDNISLELQKCPVHSMDEVIFCENCNGNCCCYCFLENHEGHSRKYLDRLDEAEEAKLMSAYAKAKNITNQLAVSQRKISKMRGDTNEVSELEIEIAQCFADVHAQLYYVEKKLQEEAKLKRTCNNLTSLNETIKSDIEMLDKLVTCVEERKNVKFNMKLLLSKLEEMKDLPTVLVSSEASEKPRLIIDEEIHQLEKYFKLDIPEQVSYKLIEVDELPKDYLETKIENHKEKLSKSQSRSSLHSEASSYSRSKAEVKDDKFRRQAVFVTHINSLDSFFVQFKENDEKFKTLEKEMKDFASKMQLGVDEVFMKELYLSKRLGRWNRVRVMEKFDVGGEERYKIKFVDFGNSAIVSKEDLMHISSNLAKRKPFAYQCRLYNPSSYRWPKDTHLELAKFLNVNRELFMYVREFSNNIMTVELDISTSSGDRCSVTDLLIYGFDALKKGVKDPSSPKDYLANRIYDNSDVFEVGNSYEVYIRHISDPCHIYIQKTFHENTLNNLLDQMENYYSGTCCDIHVPIKDSFVIVSHKTECFGNWHRAKIVEVFNSKKIVNAILVDLGITVSIPWKSLRILSELFKQSECLVTCAKLSDVAPLNGLQWGKEVSSYLEQFVSRTVPLKMLISNNDPLEIILFQTEQDYDLNINAMLVEQKLALSTGKFTDTMKWLRKEDRNEKEDNNCLLFKSDSDDDECDDVAGVVWQVEIVQFDNPFSFYVSFNFKKTENEKLNEELQIHYKSQKQVEKEREWQKDDKVIAFDKTDNMYYRGIIRAVDGNKYCVDLLDKPVNLWVTSERLRMIHPYFATNFPNCVFKCHMVNIKPAGDSSKWSHLSLEWFEMLFKKYENIYIQKIGDDETKSSMPVSLWYSKLIQGSALEPSYRKYISIDKKVVTAGLAFWANNQSSQLPPIIQQTVETKDEVLENGTEQSVEKPVPSKEQPIKGMTKWLPPAPLKEKNFYAYITCIAEKGFIFIREENLQQSYKDMEKNMEEYFKTLPHCKFNLKENMIVTVRYEGLYYRSVILKVLEEDKALILMVDFGSDHIVKKDDIYNKIMYPSVPEMVTKIKLYDVHSKTKTWTDEDVDTLIKTASEYARIVIICNSYDGTPLANVYDLDGVCLNDEIVRQCQNLFRSSNSLVNKVDAATENIPKSKTENCEEIIEIDEQEQEIDEQEQEIDEKEETTKEKAEMEMKRYTYAELTSELLKRDIIDVYDYKTISFYHPDTLSTKEDFEALTKTIRERVNDLEPLEGEEVYIGLPCLCLFEEDNEWYRAKISRVDAQNCGYVTVIYVDYGNFEVVKLSALKQIKPEWLDFPARFVDAVINFKLLRTDQENILTKHVKALSGETKYVKIICDDPVLVHVYDKDDDSSFYYKVFIENGIVQI